MQQAAHTTKATRIVRAPRARPPTARARGTHACGCARSAPRAWHFCDSTTRGTWHIDANAFQVISRLCATSHLQFALLHFVCTIRLNDSPGYTCRLRLASSVRRDPEPRASYRFPFARGTAPRVHVHASTFTLPCHAMRHLKAGVSPAALYSPICPCACMCARVHDG